MAEQASFIMPTGVPDHVISELALTAELVHRLSKKNSVVATHCPDAEDVLAFCWEQLRGGDALHDLMRKYPDLFAAVSTYATFRSASYNNADMERLIRHLVLSRGVASLEFPPWRGLDIALALRHLKITGPWDERKLLAATWLNAEPEPWLLSESAAYSLTHTVFYVTDFGFLQAGLPKRLQAYLLTYLPVWCEYFNNHENFDLLSEMLMVSACLPAHLEELGQYWTYLAHQQRGNGLVPGPVDLSVTENLNEQMRTRASFWAHYHTTLVTIMAGALTLSHHQTREAPSPKASWSNLSASRSTLNP
jgi:hypothetical protein